MHLRSIRRITLPFTRLIGQSRLQQETSKQARVCQLKRSAELDKSVGVFGRQAIDEHVSSKECIRWRQYLTFFCIIKHSFADEYWQHSRYIQFINDYRFMRPQQPTCHTPFRHVSAVHTSSDVPTAEYSKFSRYISVTCEWCDCTETE